MPLPKLTSIDFALVLDALLGSKAHRATLFLDKKTVIRAARRFKPERRDNRAEILVTYGQPNYLERAVIARYKRDSEPLPAGVQLHDWPKKKSAARASAEKKARYGNPRRDLSTAEFDAKYRTVRKGSGKRRK